MFLQCRGCGQSVPGGLTHCQFCGAALAGASASSSAQAIAGERSIGGGKPRPYERLVLETPAWVETAYTVCSGLYALGGLVGIGLALLARRGDGPGFGIFVGLVQIALGVAMVRRNEFIRTHIGLLLWISAAMNGFLAILFGAAALGAGGLMWMALVAPVFNLALNLALIWLNNEIGWELAP